MPLRLVATQPDPQTPAAPAVGQVIPTSALTTAPVQLPAVTTPAPLNARPVVQFTGGSALALVAAGGGAVLVLGAVLVSMLLAVAITGLSVAVVAVVLRSLLNHHNASR